MKSANWPRVSVVIVTYKRPGMLSEALESVLCQTYDDFEVWVVDDGSFTAKPVVEEYDKKFSDRGIALKLLDLPENTGYYTVPRNHATQLCHGAYIAHLDDDNIWFPHHLETLMDTIEGEKDQVEIVYSRWEYIGDGPVLGESPYVEATNRNLVALVQGPNFNFIDTSSMIHSKAVVRFMFGGNVWSEAAERFGDWEFVARCAQFNLRFKGVDSVTFQYRWHGNNLQLTRPVASLDTAVFQDTDNKNLWHGKEAILD